MNTITSKPRRISRSRTIWTLSGKLQPDSTPQTIEIMKLPFRIGRRPDLELSMTSVVVSGKHLELNEKGGILFLRDLGSTNGTFVNGDKVDGEILLSEGDWIEVGDVHLRVGTKSTPAGGRIPLEEDSGVNKTQHIVQGTQESGAD